MEINKLRTKKFQKNKEDFVCEDCDTAVHGDGYRNHCPACLVSKHVDENPGDRAADCGGLMDVADIDMSHGELSLIHKCRTCGYEKKNKTHPEDDIEAITAAMKLVHENK